MVKSHPSYVIGIINVVPFVELMTVQCLLLRREQRSAGVVRSGWLWTYRLRRGQLSIVHLPRVQGINATFFEPTQYVHRCKWSRPRPAVRHRKVSTGTLYFRAASRRPVCSFFTALQAPSILSAVHCFLFAAITLLCSIWVLWNRVCTDLPHQEQSLDCYFKRAVQARRGPRLWQCLHRHRRNTEGMIRGKFEQPIEIKLYPEVPKPGGYADCGINCIAICIRSHEESSRDHCQ